MTTLSLHVLDTSRGAPAGGLVFTVAPIGDDGRAGAPRHGITDDDGRAALAGLSAGHYRLYLATGVWFAARGQPTFFVDVVIELRVEADRHHHVPLLLAPFAYSTACMPG